MKRLPFLIFTLLSTIFSTAQNTFTAVHHDNVYDVKSTPYAEEVTTETSFYNNNSTEYKKSVTKLTPERRIASETRYDIDGNKTEMLVFQYDSIGNSIARRFDRWNAYAGHTIETAYYTYDKNSFLIEISDQDSNGNIFRTTQIINNELGYPIELKVLDAYGNLYGKETSIYDYENNLCNTTYWNNKGEKITEQKGKIDFKTPVSDDVFNEYGDLVKSGDNELEYKYDKNGNWIKMVSYKIENGKRIKKAVHRRKIKYSLL